MKFITKNHEYLLVNFGGPRDLSEIEPFLKTLLTDKEVIRTRFPQVLHNLLFQRVAKKRAQVIRSDYEKIGGKSLIYEDTEKIASILQAELNVQVYTFHRYLSATHKEFFQKISKAKDLIVFPFFPQFSFATTGSIARFFHKHLPLSVTKKMKWIKSYPEHPSFIQSYQTKIHNYLKEKKLKEKECLLFFSAHGLPKKFIETGDVYQRECEISYLKIIEKFSKAQKRLCYQSKFGRGEWIRPYTDESCETILDWCEKKHVVFVPLSFTSDHIETLFEIEDLYLPIIRKKGLKAYRVPALNLEKYWINAIKDILEVSDLSTNSMLIR